MPKTNHWPEGRDQKSDLVTAASRPKTSGTKTRASDVGQIHHAVCGVRPARMH